MGTHDTLVDVVAAAINATQIQPSEIALGHDLRPVARRFLAALPPGWHIESEAVPTNHGNHVFMNHVYPACAMCVAGLTSAEVAMLDNILGRTRTQVTWVNREVLIPSALA